MTLKILPDSAPRVRVPDPLAPTRSSLWWLLVILVAAVPTATALSLASSSELDGPLTVFSLGFLIPSALGPLLAVMLYVVPFSGQVTDGWLLYTRTRRSLRSTLLRHALLSAAIPFTVFVGGTLILGAAAFDFGPFGLDGGRPADAEAAMFTQIMSVSTPLYVLVVALWQGLWAAIFSLLGFLVLLLTGRRALAFALPLIGLWVDNAALDTTDHALVRTVSSIDPFTVVQAPIWVAAVPLIWWVAAIAILYGVLRRRLTESPTLR